MKEKGQAVYVTKETKALLEEALKLDVFKYSSNYGARQKIIEAGVKYYQNIKPEEN